MVRAVFERGHEYVRIRTHGDAWQRAIGNVIAALACWLTG
jgi:hypothetical protein